MTDSELEILKAAVEKARERVQKDPSKGNLEAYEKAMRLLSEYMEGGKAPAFESRLAAVEWLKRQGYKIGKSKLYKDVKAGKLRMQANGSILEEDLKRYAKHLTKPEEIASDEESARLVRGKLEAEIRKLQEQIEQISFKNKILRGEYVERARVETEQAIKAAALRAGLMQLYETHFRECVELVGGELSRTRDAINFWMEKTNELLDSFARMDEIEVRVNLAN